MRSLQRCTTLLVLLGTLLSLTPQIGLPDRVAQAQSATSVPDNHLFTDGRKLLDASLYPQNHDFGIGVQPQSEGTAIPNSDFNTLSGWTVSDSTTVQAVYEGDNVAGSHLHLKAANQWALSSSFTVGSSTQSLQLYYMTWTARSATETVPMYVEVASGANYDTFQTIGTLSGHETEQWQTAVLDVQAYQGQTVKLRLRSDGDGWRQGNARIDSLALQIQVPGWKPSDANVVQMANDDNRLSGAYLLLNDKNQSALSAPFSVPAEAQSLSFDYAAWTTRDANETAPLFVEVFSGSSYGTYTLLSTHWGSQLQGWQQGVVDLQAFQGQTVRLRFRSDSDPWRGGRARLDNVALRAEVPGWQISSAQRVFVSSAQLPQGASRALPTIDQQNFDQIISTDTIPNASFNTGAQALPTSTYPANAEFDSLSGWAVSDSAQVQLANDANNHSGPHLLLNSAQQWAVSNAVSVPTNTQSLHFDYAAWTDSDGIRQIPLFVEAMSGPDWSTTTLIGTAYGQQTQGWRHAVLDLQAFQGRTIKLRFRSDNDPWRNGRARLDNLAFRVEVPSWKPSDSNQVRLEQGTSDGPFLFLDGIGQSALSTPFVVPQNADRLFFGYQAWSTVDAAQRSRLYVEALSGSDYGVYTLLGTVWGSQIEGWLPGTVDLQAFRGQPIRLRFRSDEDTVRQGRARIDTVSLRSDLLGWVRSSTTAVSPGGNSLSASADGPDIYNPDFSQTRQSRPASEYPANFNFDTGAQALPASTYPPNPDFASLSGWLVSNSNLVKLSNDAGNLSGPALNLQAAQQWAASNSFTIPSTAQSLRFDYKVWTPHDDNGVVPVFAEILTGNQFATTTLIGTASGSKSAGWKQAVLDVQAFQGKTVKLRFHSDNDPWRNGQALVDNLAFYSEVPQWKPSDSNQVQLKQEAGASGWHLALSGTNRSAMSEPFIVAWGAQSLHFDYKAWSEHNANQLVQIKVEIFGGSDYGTYTLAGIAGDNQSQTWKHAVLDLQRFQGQTIKLRFHSDNQARIDNVGLYTEVPEWVLSDSNQVQIVQDSGVNGPYAQLDGSNQWLLSLAFPVPSDAQQLEFRYTARSQQGASVSARLFVEALSGNNYDVYTLLSTLQGTQSQGWQQASLDLRSFRGRTIKLRFRSDDDGGRQGRASFDTLRLTRDPATATPQNPTPAYAITIDQENAWVESDAFTLPEAVDRVKFAYASWAARDANEQSRLFVEVLSGADFKVNTPIGTVLGTHNQGWQNSDLSIGAFRGRTIKLRFRSDNDPWRKGRARLGSLSFTQNGGDSPAGWDYQQNTYLQLDGSNQWASSSAFTVPAGQTQLRMAYVAWTQRDANEQSRLFVEVLGGANFAQVSPLVTLQGSAITGWREQTVLNLQAFQGQNIKLRFRADDDPYRDGRVRIAQLAPEIEALRPAPSSYSCQVKDVVRDSPLFFTTPAEPYIVRIVRRHSNATVMFTAGSQGASNYAAGRLAPMGYTLGFKQGLNTLGQLTFVMPPQSEQTPYMSYYIPIFVEVCTFGDWQHLISFRPPASVQNTIVARQFNNGVLNSGRIYPIENAVGDINLDYYAVEISASALPFIPVNLNDPFGPRTGVRFTPQGLLEYFRTHINLFTSNEAIFTPYDEKWSLAKPAGDGPTWRSTSPVGSVLSIDLARLLRLQTVDTGGVVTAAHSSTLGGSSWIFSSMYTPRDLDHPVSGNREFGIKPKDDTWLLYTRGADRVTNLLYYPASEIAVFPGGDNLWHNVFQNITSFVNANPNQGAATYTNRNTSRYFWPAICITYWAPSTSWIGQKSNGC